MTVTVDPTSVMVGYFAAAIASAAAPDTALLVLAIPPPMQTPPCEQVSFPELGSVHGVEEIGHATRIRRRAGTAALPALSDTCTAQQIWLV